MKYLSYSVFFIFISCTYPEMIRNEIVYSNNFEDKSLKSIDGGDLLEFNNTIVLGDFNNDGFNLSLDNIGEHDYIFISFDLYIHGSWDGNFNGFSENDQPDKWIMELNPEMNLHNDISENKFVTTFSNSPCWPNYCLRQSYPEAYPFENNPKTGSFTDELEKRCSDSFFGSNSTLYRVEKGFSSSGDNILIRFYDELYQPNAIDKDGKNMQKCDESWSIDNLKVRVIDYK